jgi:hypothetical protein
MSAWVPYVQLVFPMTAVAGLLAVAIGAFVAGRAGIVSKAQAIEIAARYPAFFGYAPRGGVPSPSEEQLMGQPGVQHMIRQARAGRWGLYLICIGTILQIIGSAPSFFIH